MEALGLLKQNTRLEHYLPPNRFHNAGEDPTFHLFQCWCEHIWVIPPAKNTICYCCIFTCPSREPFPYQWLCHLSIPLSARPSHTISSKTWWCHIFGGLAYNCSQHNSIRQPKCQPVSTCKKRSISRQLAQLMLKLWFPYHAIRISKTLIGQPLIVNWSISVKNFMHDICFICHVRKGLSQRDIWLVQHKWNCLLA